jgi:hypothetical protein
MMNAPEFMKPVLVLSLFLVMLASLPLAGQEKLYPIRLPREEVSVLLTGDRTAYSIDKAFQLKLTLGFPDEDRVAFIPKTSAPLIVLSLRVQNVSQRPVKVDISKFTSTDEQGRVYTSLTADEAFTRIAADPADGIGSKTLRSISLGRAGNRPDENDLKDDVLRYSLRPGDIPGGSVREGMIFFEAPAQKKFTVSIVLGDLWAKPLVFSTEKSK